MKFAGAHGITRSRVPLIAMLALAGAIGLAGCEGDDGKDGAIGPTGPASTVPGPTGATGPAGPTGPAGQPVVQKPLESCAVCHDAGSVYAVDDAHQVADQGAFADFKVAPDVAVPADLVVSFSATVDGAPATTATFYRAYTWDGTTRTSLINEINADLTNLFANNGDGTYSIRIVNGVARFGSVNNRYLVILQTGANELEIAAVGDYPAAIPLAGLASSQACVDCHGASGEVGRFDPMDEGGHYSAPMSVNACVVCHRPGVGYGDLPYVVHGIHNAHDFPGGKFVSGEGTEYDTTYPTYMTNCSVCHKDDSIVPATGGSALAAANAMPVTPAGCFSCHGSMESPSWDFTNSSFHLGFDETTTCTTCHSPGNIAPATVADFHNGIATGNAGIIWNGVDTSVTEGAKFDWQITGIVDNGTNLLISWAAKYNNVDVNPCNATVGPGAPVFHAAAGGNLSMLRNYAQGDDFILGQDSGPGQARAVNVTTTNTTCAGNVATTTIPVDPGITAKRGIVALQGKPRVVNIDPTATGPMSVRAKTPTREWVVGTGALPTASRRDIVDTSQCLKCHVGSLYQHGGNRVDNVDMCVLCHNSASNEKNVRLGMGVEASEAYDGRVGQTFEMKTMLHAIHSAGREGASPIVIYRNRGIYAWATGESLLPNWDAATACQVVSPIPPATTPAAFVDVAPFEAIPAGMRVTTIGNIVNGARTNADGSYPTVTCQVHNFHTPTYPRALNSCAACHGAEDFDLVPDQSKAVATTLDAGQPDSSGSWANQLDDVLQGAGAAACTSCHSTGFARGHAYQNGWIPAVFPNGRQDILDEAN